MKAQSTGVSVVRSFSRAVTAFDAVGFANSGKSGWSMSSWPGATSDEPAPPTMTTRGTPASASPARRVWKSSESFSCGSPSRGPIALMAASCPAASEATPAGSEISPTTMLRRSAGSIPEPSRVTAVTSWPRSRASGMRRCPSLPRAPKRMILAMGRDAIRCATPHDVTSDRGAGLRRSLLLILGGRVAGVRRLAADALAGAVGVLRRRVRDDVEPVEDGRVVARAAGDAVDLAVAGAEHVVAVPAVERVADLVARGGDVGPGHRPEDVVPVAADRRVDAAVGEDDAV